MLHIGGTLLDKDKINSLKCKVNWTAGKTKRLIIGEWIWNRLSISVKFVSFC